MSRLKLTKHIEVCDIGQEECDNSNLHRVRLTVDGRTRTLTLCHAVHAVPVMELMGEVRGNPRARIFTLDEIEAKRKTQRPRPM